MNIKTKQNQEKSLNKQKPWDMEMSRCSAFSCSSSKDKRRWVDTRGKFFTYAAKIKLLLTYPHREEDRRIAMASLHIFEIDVVKSLTQWIKNLYQLDFFTKSLTILFVSIYSELRVLSVQQKRGYILILLWKKVYYLWLKKSIK